MSRSRRLAMVDRGHPKLSVVKQCRLLRLSRSSVYYRPTPAKPADLELMSGMDRQYLKTPYYGSRRMTVWLRTQGHLVNRKRVRRLMRTMGLCQGRRENMPLGRSKSVPPGVIVQHKCPC